MTKKVQFWLAVTPFLLGMLLPFVAHAESVLWTTNLPGDTPLCVTRDDGSCPSVKEIGFIKNAVVQVTYNIRVINAQTGAIIPKGNTVPAGTKVKYEFAPHEYTDIYWFGTGGSWDSPYGDWIPDALKPAGVICQDKNYAGTNVYAALSVNQPQKTLTGLPSGCETASDGVSKICTLDAPGAVPAVFTFDQTYGNFYGAIFDEAFKKGAIEISPATCKESSLPMKLFDLTKFYPFRLDVPIQSISYPLTVEATPNTAPASPTLSLGGACVAGQPYSISMASTDPDGDQVRYGVDWNADGSIDEYVPPTGFVPSGTQQNASHVYALEGTKIVRVAAEDDGGLASGWASVSFMCAPEPPDDPEPEPDESCPTGQILQNGVCVPVCPAGQTFQGGQCMVVCPAGQHAVGNFCICNDTNMPPNTAGACTQEVCPPGFQWDPGTSQCVAVAQCSLPTICSSQTSVLNQCTGQSTNCALNGPGWFCSGGICRPPPPPVASISAIPSLVSVGATTNVAWTSQNSIACSVTGNNGDGGAGWSGTSGAHASRPIQSQTIYTLSCQGFDGSAVTRTATVNIIPGEEEPCSPGFHHENGVCVPN